LTHLPGGFRWLKRNDRTDVILYLQTMAGLLEQKLEEELRQYDKLITSAAEKKMKFFEMPNAFIPVI
jgi:hypothetical protein